MKSHNKMKLHNIILAVAIAMLSNIAMAENSTAASEVFTYDKRITKVKPWTSQAFQNDPNEFQFAIIGDRTGGANVEETFKHAVDQLNLLQPEFVINVGDFIEGYSEKKKELHAEWDELDKMLSKLNMPLFRTPGNHDIANKVAQEVWNERYGASYYHFVYKNVLFVVIDSENPPREGPEGIKDDIALYNKLQTEDPAKAKAMLAEFMKDEAVVAALGKPVEFNEEQMSYIKKTLEENANVRWTFFFLHEPIWENPSESFKALQKVLKDRKYTFFAGHLHYYDYDNIKGKEHITMGPAGASFHHEGPGNVDHLMWVTMTEEGPEMGNIALKGIFNRKGLDPSLFGAYDRKGADSNESKKEKK